MIAGSDRKTLRDVFIPASSYPCVLTHVVLCIVECDGRILLLKRSAKVSTNKWKWSPVTGFLDGDEGVSKDATDVPFDGWRTSDSSAYRELLEELGLRRHDVTLEKRYGAVYIVDNDKIWCVHPYLFRIDGETKALIRLDWENTECAWTRVEELQDYDTIHGLRYALRLLMQVH